MNKKPFFSIITCTKNSAIFVQKNIDSVKRQSCRDYEHIFIDGKSTDDTLKKIERYKNKNNKIRLYSSSPKGISEAMNEGIGHSRGKYILHLHSDDWLYNKNILKEVKNKLIELDYPDWVYGQICVRENTGSVFGYFPKFKILKKNSENRFSFPLLKLFNFIPHQSTFIKKEVFNKHGFFDESLSSKMDYDLWLRVANKTTWQHIDNVVTNYTIRPEAMSSGIINVKENRKNLVRVRSRYLKPFNLLFANLFDFLTDILNKTRR